MVKFRKPCREECKRHSENVATTNMREARADVIGAQWKHDVNSEGMVLNLTILGVLFNQRIHTSGVGELVMVFFN